MRCLRFFPLGLFALLSTPALLAQTEVKINEVLAANRSIAYLDDTISDYVELVNTSSSPVSLSDASLSDSASTPRKWVFPAGVSIPANGRLVVLLDPERPASTSASPILSAPFGLKEEGDQIYFFGRGLSGPLLDSVPFGIQVKDLSISRVPDGSGDWKLSQPTPNAPNQAIELGLVTSLRVNEWMARPTSGDDWFELFNPGPAPVALAGHFLSDTPTQKDRHRIPPLSFIGSGSDGYARFWANNGTNSNQVNFALSASGETIGLYTARLAVVDEVTYGQQEVGVSEGRLPDGTATIRKFPVSASPGDSNYLPFPGLIVNEILSHTDPPLEDAVEFRNTTSAPIDISGWWLSNRRTQLQRYQIPQGSVVPANGYIVFYEYQFNGPSALSPFAFNSARGDEIYLSQYSSGQLTGYRVSETFGPAENGVSFGPVETSQTGVEKFKFVPLARRTFGMDNPDTLQQFRTGKGAPNSSPRIGPVVISEVMYHPPTATSSTSENVLDEYIEIRNITPNPLPLYDPAHPANKWRLKNAVSFAFPGTVVLPGFGYALVVSFDPSTQPAQASSFRSKYNVPANVPLYGPYTGTLSNARDSVELYKPDPPQTRPPDLGYVPYILVDKLAYTDGAPWPATADGGGHSLQRKNLNTFGNDPVNWEGAPPTAGRNNSPEIADTDGDGMTDVWEDANGFNKNSPTDAALDVDNDGFTNLQEYIAGTNPRDPQSHLRVQQITHNFRTGGSSIAIRFQAAAGKSYSVQYRNNWSPATSWQKLADVPPSSTSRLAEILDLNATNRTDRYYRVITPAAD